MHAGLSSQVAAPQWRRETHHEKVFLAPPAMTLNLARNGAKIVVMKKTFKGNPVCLRRVATR